MNAYRLYQHLTTDGVKVDLAHGIPGHPKLDLYDKQFFISDISVNTPAKLVKFLVASQKWLRRNARHYDIFHGINIFESTITPATIAHSLGLPTFVKPSNHHSGFAGSRGFRRLFLLPQLRRIRAKQLDGIISISSEISEEMAQYGIQSERNFQIPNGVNTNLFRPPSEREKTCLLEDNGLVGKKVILFVGEIGERKRPHWIVNAIANSEPEARSKAALIIVGPSKEPEYLTALKNQSSQLSEADIRFIDFTSDIRKYYKLADFFILPSKGEGMSNAMLEALASGLPVISSRVSGSGDVIQNGENGYIIDSQDELTKLINEILNDDIHINGQKCIDSIAERFSIESVAQRHKNIFMSHIAKRTLKLSTI